MHTEPGAMLHASAAPPSRRRVALLVVILLVAAGLRFWNIDQPLIDAFSWRQASTAMMADNLYRVSYNPLFPAVNWVGPEPGYQGREFQSATILAAAGYHLFGQHDWVGRSVGATFGVVGVLGLYLLVRRVWDDTHALAVAAFLAMMPGAAFTDRSLLPDPVMVAVTTVGMWLWVEYFLRRRTGWLVAAACVWTLGVLTKLPGIVSLVPLIYAAATLPRGRLGARGWLKFTGALALCLIPVVAWYAWAVHVGKTYPPYHTAGSGNFLWEHGPRAWLREWWYVDAVYGQLEYWALMPAGIVLVGLGLLAGPPRPEAPAARWFFHWWMIGGVVLYVLAAKELDANPWNLHVYSPVAAAFGGRALVALWYLGTEQRAAAPRWGAGAGRQPPRYSRTWAAARVAAGVGLLLLGTAHATIRMQRPYAYDTWKMGTALGRLSQPGESVVTVAHDVGDPIGIYYAHRYGWVFPVGGGDRAWGYFLDHDEAVAEFESLRDAGADWFGVVYNARDDAKRTFREHHAALLEHVARTCELVEQSPRFAIYRITPRDPSDAAPAAGL